MNPQVSPSPIPPNLPPHLPAPGSTPTMQVAGEDPGKVLAIVALGITLLIPFAAFIGTILSIVAHRKSSKAGYKNTPALAGIIIGIITTICEILVAILVVMIFGQLIATCAELGPGVHKEGATTITCSDTYF